MAWISLTWWPCWASWQSQNQKRGLRGVLTGTGDPLHSAINVVSRRYEESCTTIGSPKARDKGRGRCQQALWIHHILHKTGRFADNGLFGMLRVFGVACHAMVYAVSNLHRMCYQWISIVEMGGCYTLHTAGTFACCIHATALLRNKVDSHREHAQAICCMRAERLLTQVQCIKL